MKFRFENLHIYCRQFRSYVCKRYYKLGKWNYVTDSFYENKNVRSCITDFKVCLESHFKNYSTSRPISVLAEKKDIKNGPSLRDFIVSSQPLAPAVEETAQNAPYVNESSFQGHGRKVYFEVYGCQMNVSDTEIIWSILRNVDYSKTEDIQEADVVLLVTCAIREGAEEKIWHRLRQLKKIRDKRGKEKHHMKIGLLGCMAERLKHKVLEKEKSVDLIAGPDSYKDLPRLLALTDNNQTAVNVLLSLDETYADVMPVRLNQNSISAFVSIMRGCDNMCTYCIVPFTRGRERSRPISSILEEIKSLSQQGVKEVTLLGQNVNSYRDTSSVNYYGGGLSSSEETHLAKGFSTVYKPKKGGLRFSDLLDYVSRIDPEMRIRFTSPHPKDFPNEVLELIQERNNICRSLHLPAQCGNTQVLERMRRGYTREAYLELVDHVRKLVPGVSLSSDFICGFCGETEDQFEDTLTLLEQVKFNMGYFFAYSMREKTTAHRRFVDDVPRDVKIMRLTRMNDTYRKEADTLNKSRIGHLELVLVEGLSKRSPDHLVGRNEGHMKVIFPVCEIPESKHSSTMSPLKAGDYVTVLVNSANSQTLKGLPLYHTTLTEFYANDDMNHMEYSCIS